MSNKNQDNDKLWWQPALSLFARLSGWIAGPVIIAVFAGKALDRKFDTEPWLFLGTVGFAFIVSSIGIVRDAIRGMEEIEKREKEKRPKL